MPGSGKKRHKEAAGKVELVYLTVLRGLSVTMGIWDSLCKMSAVSPSVYTHLI
jgi:hypothetical protein